MCIDANFQLKRTRDVDRRSDKSNPDFSQRTRKTPRKQGAKDPELPLPLSREIPRAALEKMKTHMESIRPPRPAKKSTGATSKIGSNNVPSQRQTTQANEAVESEIAPSGELDDKCEPGIPVPNSVLDTCESNFTAANGERVKANTQWFEDTGVVAILCRHDCPIFWANMWTAGEQQFYAFTLVDELLKQLPSSWQVGILYDVACTMARSEAKWGFLPQWAGRLTFAISVFHAYGHQWVCQQWYHPRKQRVWGMSDGEGCERFWALLRRLIPSLRVSGVSAATLSSWSQRYLYRNY